MSLERKASKNGGVIFGAYSLPENDYDGHALQLTLEQVERVAGYRPAVGIGDKEFRGQSHCGQTKVVTPERGKKKASAYRNRSVGMDRRAVPLLRQSRRYPLRHYGLRLKFKI